MALTPARCVAAVLALAGALSMSVSTTDRLGSVDTERASDVVASRFLVEKELRPSQAMQRHASRVLIDTAVAFNPVFVSAPQPILPLASVALTPEDALQIVLSLPFPRPELTPTMEAVPLPTPRPMHRLDALIHDPRLFNDAQIASMKSRLNLTAEQERLWPAVELELRGLSWRRSASRADSAALPVDVSAVQRLKLAYEKLARTLSDDQKREVRLMMWIMGL